VIHNENENPGDDEWSTLQVIGVDGVSDIDFCQVDGEEQEEMIVTATGSNEVRVLRFDEMSSSFSTWKIKGSLGEPATTSMMDISGDDIGDLVVLTDQFDMVEFFRTSLQGAYGQREYAFPSMGRPILSMVDDFDMDGIQDLLVCCDGVDSKGLMTIYYGTGEGTPSNADLNIMFQTGGPTDLVVGDFDGDGASDIGGLLSGDDSIEFRGLDSILLGSKSLGQGPHEIIVAGLDGDDDIVVSNQADTNLSIFMSGSSFYANGSPTFEVDLHPLAPQTLASGDIDGDGLVDIVVGGQNGLRVLFNTGNSTPLDANQSLFSEFQESNITSLVTGNLDMGDEDANDHTVDIALINGTSNRVEIYPNLSGVEPFDPSHRKVLKPEGDGTITHLSIGLIDDDGLLDLVVATDDGNLTIFFQDMGYSMGFDESKSLMVETGRGIGTLETGDIDDDGLCEIGVLGSLLPVVTVLEVEEGGYTQLINLSGGSGDGGLLMEDVDGDERTDVLLSSSISRFVSITQQNNIAPLAQAEIWSPVPFDEGTYVTFFGGNSSDSHSDEDTLEYMWDFGGDGTDEGELVQHRFLDDGEYNVTLTVVDRDGLEDTATINLTVGDLSPEAMFDAPATVDEGSLAVFDDTSMSFPDGIVNWTWEFGDGHSIEIGSTGDPDVDHVYQDDGSYAVNLTVEDEDGSTDTHQTIIMVNDLGPTSGIEVSDQTPMEGETITFTSISNSYPDDIVNWTWDFGNGEIDHGEEVTQTFWSDGQYNVTLTVIDEDGSVDSMQMLVTVEDVPPVAIIGTSPGQFREGDDVSFIDLSRSLHPLVNWTWEFGDGTVSHESGPGHVYETKGEYVVNLTVIDGDGGVSSNSTVITVLDTLIPDLGTSRQSAPEGDEIQFLDRSTSYHEIVNWTWDLGDGHLCYQEEPFHVYEDNGTYHIVLTVRAADGSEGVCEHSIVITDTDPVITNLYTQCGKTVVTEDSRLQFRVACNEAADSVVRYEWDLDTNGEFEVENVTLVNMLSTKLVDEGIFTVTVRVWDHDSYAEEEIVIEVLNQAPEVELAHNVIDSGTIRFFASYFNDTDSDMDTLMFQWAFGGDFGEPTNQTEMEHHFDVDGIYTVRLRVIDDDGMEATDTITVVVDRTSPRISALNLEQTAYIDDLIPVRFEVNDSFDISLVKLHYVIDGVEGVVDMTHEGDGVYIASIPPQNRTVTIDLWVVATDSSNNTGQTGVMSIQVEEQPSNMEIYILGLTGTFAVVGGMVLVARRRYLIDDVFIIFQDGCLISHDSRRLRPGVDDDLLSSMLIAIQEFVMDSFKDEEETGINRLDFGEKKVLVERGGEHLHGRGPSRQRK
jgi:PKD repeat protein